MRTVIRAAAFLLLAQSSSNAVACTLCQSDLAQSVRAGAFGPGFWLYIAAATFPFISVLVAAAIIHGHGETK